MGLAAKPTPQGFPGSPAVKTRHSYREEHRFDPACPIVPQVAKNPPANARAAENTGLIPGSLGQEDPLEWEQRSLAGYSPWGHKEPDTTE